MSDYEDDMDVDVPKEDIAVQFSSSNTGNKGKRSAANLPVEIEDNLPWVEKYRPNSLADVSGHQDILATINKFVSQTSPLYVFKTSAALSDCFLLFAYFQKERGSWWQLRFT
jgi:hypothetical protein